MRRKGCSKKHGDFSSLFTSNTIAFKKGDNILVGAASKYEDDVVVFQNMKFADNSRPGLILSTLVGVSRRPSWDRDYGDPAGVGRPKVEK